MMARARSWVLAGLILAGGALAPGGALAEPPWLAPETVSAPSERAEQNSLALAVASSGDALAAWVVERDGERVVRAATRAARGGWQAPQDISGPIGTAMPPGVAPQAAITAAGDAIVVWVAGSEHAGIVTCAVRPGASGRWLPPEPLSAPGSGGPQLAVEPSGTAVATWSRDLVQVEAATRPAASGSWSDPVVLSAPGERPIGPRLTAGSDGSMAVWWSGFGGSPHVALRPPGGAFSAPQDIPGGLLPLLAIAPGGQLLALQIPHDPDGRPDIIESSTRPPGGSFEPFSRIPSAPGFVVAVDALRLTTDDDGNALATWFEIVARTPPAPSGNIPRTVVAERPAGGAWGAPTPVSQPNVSAAALDVAVNRTGTAVVGFLRRRGSQSAIRASVRPAPDEDFGAAEEITPFLHIDAPVGPAIDDEGVAALAYLERVEPAEGDARVGPGRVRSVLRARDEPREIRLSAAQLLVNQRISQAAVRRANAVEARIREGLTGTDIRSGALTAGAFAAGIEVVGEETGALTPQGPGRPLEVPAPERGDSAAVRMTAAQLLINQRIAQAAVRRANRLAELFAGGLTGAHVADGALGPQHLAPGLSIAGAAGGGAAPAPAEPEPTTEGRQGGRVTLSAAQLRINQRISQAAVRRLNSLVTQLERGLPGSSFAPGSITRADLAPELAR